MTQRDLSSVQAHIERAESWSRRLWAANDLHLVNCDGTQSLNQHGLLDNIRKDCAVLREHIKDLEVLHAGMREALESARLFVEAEYRDPSQEPDGEWLPRGAREVHDQIVSALSALPTGEAVTVGDPYARGIQAGIEAAAKLVVGWREIEPVGDEYERWNLGCKLVADELADRIRTGAAFFAPNVPTPSPSEREEKLEAALKELGEASRGSHLAYPSAGEYAEAETRLSRALESADALLSDTEGE